MKYLLMAVYGVIAIIFFGSALSLCMKRKKKTDSIIYRAYDKKVKKSVPPIVVFTNILFGLCMVSFFIASAYYPQNISTTLYIISAYALLAPVAVMLITWIWMQFHKKK